MTSSAETITSFRDGRFTTESVPAWWDAEHDRLFSPGLDRDPGDVSYGAECGNQIRCWWPQPGLGAVVELTEGDRCRFVWMPTEADYLEFLTTRAPAFVGLTAGLPVADSIEHIRNAFIAFARHGHGDHVDRLGGESRIDLDRDYERARRQPRQTSVGEV